MPNTPRPLQQELLLHPTTYREALAAVADADHVLSSLHDVDVPAPADGYVLAWSQSSNKWVAVNPGSTGGGTTPAVSPLTLTAHTATETPLTLTAHAGQTATVQQVNQGFDPAGVTHYRLTVNGVDKVDWNDFGSMTLAGNLTVALTIQADILFARQVYTSPDGGDTKPFHVGVDGTVTGTAFVGVKLFDVVDKSAQPANGQLYAYNQATSLFDPTDPPGVVLVSVVVDAKTPGTVNVGAVIPPNMVGQVERFKVEVVTNVGPGTPAQVTFGTAATPGLFAPATPLSVTAPGDVYEADSLGSGTLVAGTQLTGTVAVGGTAAGSYQVRFVFRVALWRSPA